MKINKNNMSNFAVIDEIHGGFIANPNSPRIEQALQSAGGEVLVQPINLVKADMRNQLVVKCKESGNTYSISVA